MSRFRWLLAAVLAVAMAPVALLAQEPATVTGRVTSAAGAPENAVSVRISALGVGTTTGADGTYRLVIPASRLRAGQQVTITAGRVGLASQSRTLTLSPGASLTQNFQLGADVLQLEGIVATGQGTATTRERATIAVSTVRSEEITRSRETNASAALAGKAPGVQVTSSAGDPGAGAYIQIRGAASVVGGTQPLWVVDGTPIDNSSNETEYGNDGTSGTVTPNGVVALNPNDIERVEILKGAAATAIYGARGANGVVLVTTKSGRPGSTRATYSLSYGRDEVTKVHELQQAYGQGSLGCIRRERPGDNNSPCLEQGPVASTTDAFSWGPLLGPGTPVFDHARELYQDANRLENNLTLSGGSDKTTYYLSLGRLDQDGVIIGPQEFERTTVRLKGTQFITDQIQAGGNIAYTRSGGGFVQQGSNISGIQLAALRTPPDFNSLPYRAENGLHRSYRQQNPTVLATGRGYDNPFWVAHELTNEIDMSRAFGNVSVDYTPTSWLRVSYLFGGDYTSDERLSLWPKSTSSFPQGQIVRGNYVTEILDSNLTATLNGSFGENLVGTLTVGQNLNQETFRQNLSTGSTLINGTDQKDFAVTIVGDEYTYRQRTDGYFVTGETTLADQLTLNATARWDGSSNFGGDGERFFYPGLGASWVFSKLGAFDNLSWLDLGKLRVSYGVSGRQPPVFANVSAFTTATFNDGWVNQGGLYSIYRGNEGVRSQLRLGNQGIKPERKSEFETGIDLAMLDQRVALGVTYYDRSTTDAILDVTLPYSSGATSQYANVAAFENNGWEATLSVTPVRTSLLNWTVEGQYSRNRSCVTDLSGAEEVTLNGFTGSTVSVVSPQNGKCQPFGVFYGYDFVRYGRGSQDQNTGADIDAVTPGAPAGAIYVGADGFPQNDPQERVLGDPNPDWLGSLRSTITIANNLTVSGLLDVKRGGQMWNGTKGAIYYFGTHKDTERFHGAGQTMTYRQYAEQMGMDTNIAGPGVNTAALFNQTWFTSNVGSGFTGPTAQFLEDASYVKLRDISVSYTLNQAFLRRLGVSTMDLTVSGRNLKTWTDYTGIDPESNLTGQSVGRGLDYFNNPQTRSFVFTVNLTR